jgi:tetratricopeptide (TPR) repeat protein
MKVPMVRPISILGVVVSVIPLLLILVLNEWLLPNWFPISGALLWMFAVLLMRRIFTGDHRKGIRLVKSGRFGDAIPLFTEAYSATKRRPWIDRYRWLLLGSASQWSYREMALCNLAFCYGQIGDGEKMKALYRQALTEFPDCILATAALRMVESVTQANPANQAPVPTPSSVK